MWKLELDDKGYWVTDGVNRHGPWTRSAAAEHWMRENPPAKPVKEAKDEVVPRRNG
jgi:hypothetical protein